MPFIDEIAISNYRAIEKFSLKPKAINIFVGSNNSGKSSILESIAISLSLNNKLSDYEGNDSNEYLGFFTEYDPKFLVRENENLAECTLKINNKKIQSTIEFRKAGYPDSEKRKYIENFIHRKMDDYFSSSDFLNRKFRDSYLSLIKESKLAMESGSSNTPNKFKSIMDSTKFTAFTESTQFSRYKLHPLKNEDISKTNYEDDFDKNIENSDYYQSILERYILTLKEKIENVLYESEKLIYCFYEDDQLKTIFMIPYLSVSLGDEKLFFNRVLFDERKIIQIDCSTQDNLVLPFNTMFAGHRMFQIELLHDKVVKNNKFNEVMELLKKIEYIKDIRRTEEGLQVSISGLEIPIPLSSMGEGFKSLLVLAFERCLLEEGILLIEEIEITLHPGYIRMLVEEILSHSSNLQFFISTHSMDLISNLLEIGDRLGKLEDIQIIRTIKINNTNEINTEILNGTIAKQNVDDIAIDLRGI